MTAETLTSWERKLYTLGGGDAALCFIIAGDFGADLELSYARYRTNGLPPDFSIELFQRDAEAQAFENLFQYFATEALKTTHPELHAQLERAPSFIRIIGEVKDPQNLDYLRDTTGVVTALLDQKGIAIFDVLSLTWWSKEEWHEIFFENGTKTLHRQINIMISEVDEKATRADWMHTRGMMKFGRPDLSMHKVPENLIKGVAMLFGFLAEDMALGLQIAEGQILNISELPPGITCHHAGSQDDLDFNNVHLRLDLPQSH